ncbi:MAG: RidA family protein [Micromonosporaceae bacterium]
MNAPEASGGGTPGAGSAATEPDAGAPRIERVNPPELARPSGFSHAVVATGGRTVHLAGQTGMDASGTVVAGGIVAQFEQALSNLLTALAAAGGTPSHLVSVTIYIVDMDAYQASAREIGAIWRRLAGPHYPAMAGIGTPRLWSPEALVELQATATLP